MIPHLRVVCGSVNVLVPASCVTAVVPWTGPSASLPPCKRMPRTQPVLDARRLFPNGRLNEGAVAIAWRSGDFAHAATILVDQAYWHDDGGAAATQALPRLPVLAAGCFDAAIMDGESILLRLREDVGPHSGGRALLRRLRRAAVDGDCP